MPPLAAAFLIATWDAAANFVDAQHDGDLKNNPSQALNVVVSAVTGIAVEVKSVHRKRRSLDRVPHPYRRQFCYPLESPPIAARSGLRGCLEKIDRIAVRVPEQHRAIAPRHVLGLLQPVSHECFNSYSLSIDIADFELKDR